ncbi:unnamed protein product [Adineta steineri]|uniref:Uncharacterized protein n=1 Tax=Adineta steineri TaxID=433720 RepID=A0A814WYW3_9BILA|nr:unnamed protein product [Adineta steineri]CAF1151880.1 unnamed protein product [Adineta steineri]CAF1207288.1 unnamed protein product [Adineta steineri]CAF3561110.1 unnamed protein product [Adineta steineri]CAF3729369.1 unnamed protein product [Adineta steineri]
MSTHSRTDSVVACLTVLASSGMRTLNFGPKFRLNALVTLANQTNPVEFTNKIYTKIKEIIDINPNQIKSTSTRLTISTSTTEKEIIPAIPSEPSQSCK